MPRCNSARRVPSHRSPHPLRPLEPSPQPAVLPSRYGPAARSAYPSLGPALAKVDSPQGFAAVPPRAPAASAIDRLIAAEQDPTAPRIQLGAYARPENAARIAELMRPYGTVETRSIRGGMGETLTRVELTPISGMASGDVLAIAERLGVRTASLVD